MKILIAEDERITRRNLQRQIESWGHEVVAAEDGAEAWDRFREQSFEIVVTDWEMPRLDGRALIERIRQSEKTSYVYLIMLTGRSEKSDLVAGMEAGADDFLAKPFDKNELRVRLNAGERIIRLERTLAARNEELSKANERMTRDLDAAAKAQRDLLPKELPDSLGAKFAWLYEPCDELGGDILNVLPLDDRYIGMYLLDVSGHGVPAALLSVTLNRVLTTRDPSASILISQRPGENRIDVVPPQRVALHLNRQFPMDSQSGRYFTIAYAVLDTQTRRLRYVLAGQPAPILARKGQPPEQLTGSGFPIGLVDDADFDEYVLQMEPGDRLYFYSDGITEARNEPGDMLQPEGLIRFIEQSREQPIGDGIQKIVKAVTQWCHPVAFDDDLSLLVLEVPDIET
jgi:sigma-B regulation protein RsbU (phosphoserine phosphatase)